MYGKKYLKFLDNIDKIIFYLLAFLVSVMLLFGTMQVFWRYILRSSLSWSEEMMRYINIWTIFLGIGLGVPRGLHTAIDAIYNVVKEKTGKNLAYIVKIISLIFGLVMLIIGIKYAMANNLQVSPTVRIPVIYVYASIPVGGLLIILFTIGEFIKSKEGGLDK